MSFAMAAIWRFRTTPGSQNYTVICSYRMQKMGSLRQKNPYVFGRTAICKRNGLAKRRWRKTIYAFDWKICVPIRRLKSAECSTGWPLATIESKQLALLSRRRALDTFGYR